MRHLLPILLAALTPTATTVMAVALPGQAQAMDVSRWAIDADDGDDGEWGGGDWPQIPDDIWDGGRSSDWTELPDDIRDSLKDMWDNWDEWMRIIHDLPTGLPPVDTSKDPDQTWERPGRCEDYDASRDWWVYENWGCG